MKETILTLLAQAVSSLVGKELPEEVAAIPLHVERARDSRHGDFATNAAMAMARAARRSPRQIAELIVAALPQSDMVSGVEIAGPGFINFRLSAGPGGGDPQDS